MDHADLIRVIESYLVERGGAGKPFDPTDFHSWASVRSKFYDAEELQGAVRVLISKGKLTIYLSPKAVVGGQFVVSQWWDSP